MTHETIFRFEDDEHQRQERFFEDEMFFPSWTAVYHILYFIGSFYMRETPSPESSWNDNNTYVSDRINHSTRGRFVWRESAFRWHGEAGGGCRVGKTD